MKCSVMFFVLVACSPKLYVSKLRMQEARMGTRIPTLALDLAADPVLDRTSASWYSPSLALELGSLASWPGGRDLFTKVHQIKDFQTSLSHKNCTLLEEEAQVTEICFFRIQEAYRLLPPVWISDIVEEGSQVEADMPLTLPRTISTNVNCSACLELIRPTPHPTLTISYAATTPAITTHSSTTAPKAIWFCPLVWGVSGFIDRIIYTSRGTTHSSFPITMEFPLTHNDFLDGIYGVAKVSEHDLPQFLSRKDYSLE
ncbi:hypothetical protein DSO57_1011769 [Entomophthora muscae]|uniref:Uncharacterized protein n=1 Tax=Entomophthora muscae TaxID=34485 RepID=A0ACC2SVD2_9FUNG|nr:hypothetical protein DSO57_1011769 [Entomophthora muscae]